MNEKMNFQKKDELDAVSKEIEEVKGSINELIKSFPQRVRNYLNALKEILQCLLGEKEIYKNELISDNLHINELTVKDLENKVNSIKNKYYQILNYKNSVDKLNNKYECHVDIPCIKDTLESFRDFIICYQSTLLLNPKTRSDELKQRLEECSNKNLSFTMAVLYVYKFNNQENKLPIQEDFNEAKNIIEKIIENRESFYKNVLDLIYTRFSSSLRDNDAIELDNLIECFRYLPNFTNFIKYHIISNTKNVNSIHHLKYDLSHTKDSNLKEDLINIFILCEETILNSSFDVKSKTGSKPLINRNHFVNWEDVKTLVCDFGSYEWKIGGGGTPFFCYESEQEKFAYSFDYSGLKSEECPVLIVNSTGPQDKSIEVLFEKFDVPAICYCNSAVLLGYSVGKNTGIVLDISHDKTCITPFYEGYHFPDISRQCDIGGKAIDTFLHQIYPEMDNDYKRKDCKKMLEKIKREICYVASDYDEEILKNRELYAISYNLIGNYCINLSAERFRSAEILFKPYLINKGPNGIEKLLVNTINSCDIDIRKDLYANIILCGGSSMIKCLPERLENEVSKLAPNMEVKVIATNERKYAAWLGGSLFSTQETFPQYVITRREYEQEGSSFSYVEHKFLQ